MTHRDHLQVLIDVHAQIVAVSRESTRHHAPQSTRRIACFVCEIPAGIDRVADDILQLVVLHVAHHFVAVLVLQKTQATGLLVRQ